ncbi:MAG TPA: beta-propeller fold lactonase family protein [Actinomycetota bacterium]|nr:beta-propeller fold lactonase family protein [Actinomycetota bacterium]
MHLRRIARRACMALALVVMLIVALPARSDTMTAVVFVANAEDGTVQIVDASTFQILRTINVIPDGASPPMTEDPLSAAAYPLVVGAAGENWAQDLDVSPDGTVVYVSRGHRADVAAFDVASGTMKWRAPVSGLRADHMTMSADGARLYVSALTENIVEVLDTSTGALVDTFATGEWPHDNVLSADGARVYNGSIGNILLPPEVREARSSVNDGVLPRPYQLTVVDADTLEVLRTYPFERGIRPFVINADETRMYVQLSEVHGVMEYDLVDGRPLRTLDLPVADGVTSDDYDFEAPHHGLALSADERLLCAAGRASDYVALISVETMQPVSVIPVDDAPGWVETSPDGSHCFAASTRANSVTVISYEQAAKVAEIETGAGPKYLAAARVPTSILE